MDADAIDDPPRLRRIDVALEHHVLDRDRTFDGGHDRGELQQQSVAHGLDEPTAETGDDRSRRPTMLADSLRRPGLILAHQARITDDVDRHDCGEFPCFAHDVLHARSHRRENQFSITLSEIPSQ